MGDFSQLLEAYQLQISEMEMLQSMYPGPKEMLIDNPSSIAERNSVIDSETGSVSSRIEFCINITIDEVHYTFEISLPPLYPFINCEAVIRCSQLGKSHLNKLNSDLKMQISSMELGDICIGILLSWFMETAPEYSKEIISGQTEASSSKVSVKKDDFSRMWVYSHHIYSKTKRKDLLQLSVEYDLTGFILPGKPGLICVEGWKNNTTTWWSVVRSWNWQKILCKRLETEEVSGVEEFQNCRRFDTFMELGSSSEIRVKSGGYHVDMGDLYKYLKKHDSHYMFKEYFGLEGTSAADS